MVVIFRELASAEACMLANAAEFRPASMGCWSAAVTTEVLLPATRLAWYTVAVGASSEPPVASSWAPIGADGPWSPSDEATLTASSFSGGRKTALPRLPPPPPPPPPPWPVALGEHVLGGGPVGTVSHRQSTVQRVACHASTRRSALSSYCHAMSIAGLTLFRGSAHSISSGVLSRDYSTIKRSIIITRRTPIYSISSLSEIPRSVSFSSFYDPSRSFGLGHSTSRFVHKHWTQLHDTRNSDRLVS